MARQPRRHSSSKAVLDQTQQILSKIGPYEGNIDLREYVLKLVPLQHSVRELGCSLISKEDAPTARDRLLYYFKKYPRTLIDGDELAVISGIGEWARRIRELRTQFGWWIYSGVTFKQLYEDSPDDFENIRSDLSFDPTNVKPDQYVLIRDEEDREAAHRWNIINGIRRKKLSVKDKLLEYFRKNVGKVVGGEELRYLAKDAKEWARRARELRTEDGWPIVTRMQGRTDLPIGAYLLEEDRQAQPHDRKIPDPVRLEVLKRDGFSCTECGWNRSQLQQGDPRKFLELHHVTFHVEKGENTAENLITLCNVCHDALHRNYKKH